jgi:FMN phosphatase YigB (HAD superfamily)
MRGATVQAVTFDYWNTLCCEPPGGYLRGRRLEAMGNVLRDAGVGDAGSELAAAYDAAWLTYAASWQANRQYTGRHAARHVVDHVEAAYGLKPGLRRPLYDAFAGASDAEEAELVLIEGVAEALGALRDLSIPLAIVCDVGFTASPVLRRHLERHGLLACFDHWAFSDEVGVYKPDRRLFEHALAGLGSPEPSRCAHVGDRRRTDMAGAAALGMRAVRLTTVFDDDDPDQGPSGDVVLSSYRELLPALGLA